MEDQTRTLNSELMWNEEKCQRIKDVPFPFVLLKFCYCETKLCVFYFVSFYSKNNYMYSELCNVSSFYSLLLKR